MFAIFCHIVLIKLEIFMKYISNKLIAMPLGVLYLALDSSMLMADALEQVNQYRQAVGLNTLSSSQALNRSAKNHADYLSHIEQENIKSMQDAHGEIRGNAGFTGKTVRERTQVENYPHHSVSENISLGNLDELSSTELLMSGIYHRFGFLNFLIDEMGVGISKKVYVYNMGRSDLSQICRHPSQQTLSGKAYDCLGKKVTENYWNQLCSSIRKQDIFAAPFKHRCNNGVLLNAAYMKKMCQSPPQSALLKGAGSYYKLCGNSLKIKASWLENLCRNPPTGAKYRGNGRYYEICDTPQKVPAYWLKTRCDAVPKAGQYTQSGRYYQSCNTAKHKISVEAMQQLDEQRYQQQAMYLPWPANNMQQVDVAFYREIPDPLPDLEESGYPISLQFNPYKVQQVKVIKFQLEYQDIKTKQWYLVNNIRALSKKNDPNKKLKQREFAWFPLQKLHWGTIYRVKVDVQINHKNQTLQWQFKTKSFLNFLE